jgi:hypothetical protein
LNARTAASPSASTRETRISSSLATREPVRGRTLEITFRQRGAEAYVFTFD